MVDVKKWDRTKPRRLGSTEKAALEEMVSSAKAEGWTVQDEWTEKGPFYRAIMVWPASAS